MTNNRVLDTRLRARLLFTLLALCSVSLPGVAQISFSSHKYPLNNPAFVVNGDLNGDGKPDLAVLSIIGGTVSTLLNNGDGTFSSPQGFPATRPDPDGPTRFSGLAVGDFNDDKKIDVLVTHTTDSSGTASIYVLFGNGDGTLQLPVNAAPAFVGITFFGVGDFNGDGKLDVACYGEDSDTGGEASLMMLLGNGDGTFTRGTTVAMGLSAVGSLIADVNQDNRLDVVFAASNQNGNVLEIFLGKGDGTFQTVKEVPSQAPSTFSLVGGDFNHDGTPDLVSTSQQIQYCEFKVCHRVGPRVRLQ